ncbi:prolyl 3-hydroxylase 2-like isoform X2 [Littorina saxatilis]|uniref:procollagen-proline 3-dioxygenase n=1 Tax=Littorina saxatilis TaxID=31220 RepID=A0AAN9B460_9CAEN
MASFGHVGTGSRVFLQNVHVDSVMKVVICVLTLTVLELRSCVADDISAEEPMRFDQLYAEGVKAYNDQLWYKCAYNLENAVNDYRNFRRTLTDCRLACKKGEKESYLDELPSDLGDFSVFATFLKHADCFRRCKSVVYAQRPGLRLNKILETTFETRKPYQYLQFCWYKLSRVKQAASASYTFYLANPEDSDVKINIAFYRDRAKVSESDFLDLEMKPYKEHYIRAMLAYREEDWLGVVDQLEKGIDQFFTEEERCRADCEDEMDSTTSSEPSHFSGLIADHIVGVLECQLGCEGNLSVVYSEPIEDFLSEQFHYLQFAYYKLEKIQQAVEATGSFLLFHPDSEVVKENQQIFMKKYKYSEDQFIPRKDVKQYVERQKKLQTLLDFLKENLMPEVPDEVFVTEDDTEPDEQSQEQPDKPTTEYSKWMDRYERLGLHLIAKAHDMQRSYRFAADGLLKQEQCEDILTLMEGVEVDKKGVQTFTMEHGRKAMIHKDESYESSMRLFMRATEVMRHYTQRYYNISESLFFKNTTMVCWRHLAEPEVENDCIPQEFGTCEPESKIKDSELMEKQFVTATYLTGLDDGDVYFLSKNATIDSSLGVKCGRIAGFQAGDRHGLHIPTSAPRCAMVITYTTYRSNDEMDYISTIQMLHQIEELRMNKRGMMNQQQVMKSFEKMGVKVVKNGTGLHGTERFVADGLASEAECMSLKNMVMSGALVGDGYDHLESKPSLISPHTEHELFQGLTVYRAAKLMHSGLVNTFSMQSFLDLSEKSRLYLEKYFNLSRPLYFDFTHLVCRTAVDDTKERDDLSHPVHADNCVLQPNGTCLKEYPAFVQRDYSAILYLNDDFEGGEFFFAHPNKSEQVSLRPKCGRLVGFNAKEFHGVKAVRSGVRCALALWFTLNRNFKELAHSHAKKVLQSIQEQRDLKEKDAEKSSAAHHKDSDPQEKSQEENKDTQDTATSKADLGLKEEGKDTNEEIDLEKSKGEFRIKELALDDSEDKATETDSDDSNNEVKERDKHSDDSSDEGGEKDEL